MTEFVVRLSTEATLTRAEAYILYGAISEALGETISDQAETLKLVSITDDVASAPAEPPAVKTRKPRGPNKAKVQEPSDPPPAGDSSMPGFLKRGA